METDVRYTIAGVFVIVLVAFITLGIIWLSAGFSVQTYTIYQVNMKESVSGLSVDAAVEYNGVNVGTVKNIRISPKDPEQVEVLLRIRSSTPITQGTLATMSMRGLTGVTFVALRDKGTDKHKLKKLPDEAYPIINTAPSILMRFDQALTEMNATFTRISASIEKLLNDENLNYMRDILYNIKTLTLELQPIIHSSVDTINLFNRETIPRTNQAISNLDTIMGDISSIANEIKDNPSVMLRGKSSPPLGPGEK
jgi:phospholipid/cholesterol/gamma-HCH transport system substrate-binding protein